MGLDRESHTRRVKTMGRKSQTRKREPARGTTSTHPARNAAGSRLWPDLPSLDRPTAGRASKPRPARTAVASRRRHPPARPLTAAKKPVFSPQSLFGSWELPTPHARVAKAPDALKTCIQRHERREVLFATRSTGAGSQARRLNFTNRRCK